MATTATPATNGSSALAPLVKLQQSTLAMEMARECGVEPSSLINTLINTVFPHGKDDAPPTVPQLLMFMAVAKRYKLDPFIKQIYAFPSKGGGVVPMVPIDGWITIVQRHEQYDGVEQIENFIEVGGKRRIDSVTTKMFRKDQSRPTVHTEYYDECYRGDTEPWRKWPIRMLDWKSYIQCARVAFGLAGIYDEDEAERIIEAESVAVLPAADRESTAIGQKTLNKTEDLRRQLAAANTPATASPAPASGEGNAQQVSEPAATQPTVVLPRFACGKCQREELIKEGVDVGEFLIPQHHASCPQRAAEEAAQAPAAPPPAPTEVKGIGGLFGK